MSRPVTLTVRRPMSSFMWSPSQVDTFRDCPMKWAYRYLGGISAPPHASAEFGTRVHAVRERWFREGLFPKSDSEEDKVARLGLSELPQPKMVLVEVGFKLAPPGLGVVQGLIDIFVPDQGAIGYQPVANLGTMGVPLVHDHKTTSDIRKYAKSVEALRTDAQVSVYGTAALAYTGAGYVDFCWHYLEKGRSLKHEPRRLRLSSSEVVESFEKVLGDARKMLSLFDARDSLRVEDVPRDARACDKYGGCPYLAICPITTEERCASMMTSTLTLEEKLKTMTTNPFPTNGQAPTPFPQSTAAQFPQAEMQAMPQMTQFGVVSPDPSRMMGAPVMTDQARALMAQLTPPPQAPPAQPPVDKLLPEQIAWFQQNPAELAKYPHFAPQVYASMAPQPPAPQAAPVAVIPVQPNQVLPPDAPPQTLADAAAAAPESSKGKRGRPKGAKAAKASTGDAPAVSVSDDDEGETFTRRDKFAIMMLDAIVSSGRAAGQDAVAQAVDYADALIAKLD